MPSPPLCPGPGEYAEAPHPGELVTNAAQPGAPRGSPVLGALELDGQEAAARLEQEVDLHVVVGFPRLRFAYAHPMGSRRWEHAAIARPGQATPFAVRFLGGVLHPLVRLAHRASFEGDSHLPARGAYLLVGNHPPALGLAEFAALAALWGKRFAGTRPLAGFAHAASFGWWPLSALFAQVGAIPSTYAAAQEALAAQVPIVVFPGGDSEGFRPFWKAQRVDFGGRLGFLKIARKAWVPVVPLAIVGNSTPLLHGSKLLAWLFLWPRLAGVKRYGLSVLALLGAAAILAWVPLAWPWRALLAWAWAGSPLAMLPVLPARVCVRVGPALAPELLFGERSQPFDDARLVEALRQVEHAVQAQRDGLEAQEAPVAQG